VKTRARDAVIQAAGAIAQDVEGEAVLVGWPGLGRAGPLEVVGGRGGRKRLDARTLKGTGFACGGKAVG
jgi:hypothetical protein